MQKDSVVGLVVATAAEGKPFCEKLALPKVDDAVFSVYANDRIALIVSGMGKTNAAMATATLCLGYRPKCICNLGAAGATGRAELGDVYAVDEIAECDRPKFKTGNPHRHRPNVLGGFELKRLATQDRPVVAAADRERVAGHGDLLDMEAAAVVQTAKRFGVDCYVFKYVTDTPENETHRDVVENVKKYADRIYDAFVEKILPALS